MQDEKDYHHHFMHNPIKKIIIRLICSFLRYFALCSPQNENIDLRKLCTILIGVDQLPEIVQSIFAEQYHIQQHWSTYNELDIFKGITNLLHQK